MWGAGAEPSLRPPFHLPHLLPATPSSILVPAELGERILGKEKWWALGEGEKERAGGRGSIRRPPRGRLKLLRWEKNKNLQNLRYQSSEFCWSVHQAFSLSPCLCLTCVQRKTTRKKKSHGKYPPGKRRNGAAHAEWRGRPPFGRGRRTPTCRK